MDIEPKPASEPQPAEPGVNSVFSDALKQFFSGEPIKSAPQPTLPAIPPIVVTPKTVETDEELARRLQEEEYSGKNKYKHHDAFGYDEYASAPVNSTPVKPPSLSELKKEDTAPKDKDYDPEIICLVCRQSPKEYIVLPNCQQPHVSKSMINIENPDHFL